MPDWISLQKTFVRDTDFPDRTFRLTAFGSVLENTLYNNLKHPFSEEFTPGGEYIPLWERRPSVRTGLCRVVVDDSVSLLFSEGHWPVIQAGSDQAVADLSALVKQSRMNETMLDAATRGSVGSIAILFRVLKGKPFFDVMQTAFLTPSYDPEDPDVLISVVERYKVLGKDLRDQDYTIDPDDLGAKFWFQRTWDAETEIWFNPLKVESKSEPTVDLSRSVTHGLGFVPIEWVKNLPGGDHIDGACTFAAAIDTVIEGDYLLSQAGRGLNYSSDPKTVLSIEGTAPILSGGSANALVLPKGSDAKLLEIGGEAARAVLEHVRELRGVALEAMHGNRANADKMTAASSGVALQTMMTGLVWLADRLRISYGEGALLGLLRMACKASQVIPGGLTVGGRGVVIEEADLELRWPAWLPIMPQDVLATAQGLVTAYAGGVLSQKSAVTRMSSLLDVDDVAAELVLIEQEAALKQQQVADLAAQAAKTAANAGPTETRQVTA